MSKKKCTAKDLMHSVSASVQAGSSMISAMEIMQDHDTDYIIVTKKNGQVAGILTATDVVDLLATDEKGDWIRDAKVDTYMKSELIVVDLNADCHEVIKILSGQHIHRVVVEHRLMAVGIVDQKAVENWFLASQRNEINKLSQLRKEVQYRSVGAVIYRTENNGAAIEFLLTGEKKANEFFKVRIDSSQNKQEELLREIQNQLLLEVSIENAIGTIEYHYEENSGNFLETVEYFSCISLGKNDQSVWFKYEVARQKLFQIEEKEILDKAFLTHTS